jgi:hypothetical protein
MKNLTFSNLGCAVIIGLLMPLGVVKAADMGDALPSSGFTEDAALLTTSMTDYQATENDRQYVVLASVGAQGPIRMDMAEDEATLGNSMTDYQALENDSQLKM